MIQLQKIIKTVKDAGFPFVKLELEAHFNGRQIADETCKQYILEFIGRENADKIVFSKFYRDGSVDSEFTFTIPTDDVAMLPKVIEAFKALAERNGRGMDTHGAGMHFSVLQDSYYPSTRTFPENRWQNFQREVKKLLPALYIGAAAKNWTRSLEYRHATVADNSKYSAIYALRKAQLEYRIFDTCYDNPDMVLEYFGIIARTLEYFADPSKRAPTLGKRFEILNGKTMQECFFSVAEQIQIIKSQMKYIVPYGMTIKEFLGNRGIKLLLTSLRKEEARRRAEIRLAYEEHKKAFKNINNIPLDEFQMDHINYYKLTEPGHPESWYVERVTGQRLDPGPFDKYLQANIKQGKAQEAINT